MSTPAGLTRFSRTITTKRPGSCVFCAAPTRPGVDFASVDAGGRWHAVCATCATSIVAQVKGAVNRLQAAVTTLPAEVAHRLPEVQALLPESNVLAAAMQDGALDTIAYDALVKLQAAQVALDNLAKPAGDVRLAALQAVAANPQASPRDRDFASSLAGHIVRKGALTPNQSPHADRLIARYAEGAAAPATTQADVGLYLFADGTIRKVYITRNDRFGCKLLHVHQDGVNDEGEPTYHGAFEYEQGGRRIVSDAVAAGTARKLTQDEAAAFGKQYSFCCNCARDLDDDRSLAAGYGPVCAENNAWWYPTYEEAAKILGRPVTKPSGKVVG